MSNGKPAESTGVEMVDKLIPHLALPRHAEATVKRPTYRVDSVPSVSVVIPCYNYSYYLTGCVKSVLDQQGVRVDVLIIDDASTDGSYEIAKRLATKDTRIRAIGHTVNRGHVATYNEGLAKVSGDYTVILSADDLLTPGSLRRATSLMEAHPSVGLAYGFPINFTDTPLPSARSEATTWIVWRGHSWIRHMCKTGKNSLRSPEIVVRTRTLRTIGGFRPELPHSGDLEMWLRAAAVSDIGYVGGADQAYYRIHPSNMHNSFDLLADISHRLRSFDIFLTERSNMFTNVESMRLSVHKVLAREALSDAISEYARGCAENELITSLSDFALDTWPGSVRLPEWRMLCRLRRGKDNNPRRDPRLLMREKKRNLTYSLAWWRRRWIGVN